MAFVQRISKFNNLLKSANNWSQSKNVLKTIRSVHTTGTLLESEGWLSKLLMVRKIDPGKESHSRLLSDTEVVYEMTTHHVKPGSGESYLNNYQKWANELQSRNSNVQLVGSWSVSIGSDQDEQIHVWRYKSWRLASDVDKFVKSDSSLISLNNEILPQLRSRQNQFMLSFSFWGHPEPQIHNSMYEMRSYVLKPGTMIEWGNNWARGVTYRKDDAVAGFFSQIGQLYQVHHVWKYEDLFARKETRESAWRKPGWDECVAYTVPLIREMRSRWMTPNSFSPIR